MQVELRKAYLDAAIDFAASEGLEIALPNIAFDPLALASSVKHYLRAFTLPVQPNVFSTCGEASNQFILQMSIYSRAGIGEIKALALADKLRSQTFPIHSELQGQSHSFKVIRPPSPASPISLDAWYSVPVRFTVETLH